MKHYHLPSSVCGVYILTKLYRVAYIGRSVNIYARLGAHLADKAQDFEECLVFPIAESMVNITERNLIAMFRPPLNALINRHDSSGRCYSKEIAEVLREKYLVIPAHLGPPPTKLDIVRDATKRAMENRLARIAERDQMAKLRAKLVEDAREAASAAMNEQ